MRLRDIILVPAHDDVYGLALALIDVGVCWVLVLASAVLLVTRKVETLRQLMLAVGLLVIGAGAFIGAVVIWSTGHRAEWAVIVRMGFALVMVWMYDKHYERDGVGGIVRHVRKILDCITGAPKRWRERWNAWLAS